MYKAKTSRQISERQFWTDQEYMEITDVTDDEIQQSNSVPLTERRHQTHHSYLLMSLILSFRLQKRLELID